MSILVMNAGSSSLKFALFDPANESVLASGQASWRNAGDASLSFSGENMPAQKKPIHIDGYGAATAGILEALHAHLPGIEAIGHRVVHGGSTFRESVGIGPEVMDAIRGLCDIAPLHNPPAIETITATGRLLPNIPQIAVFDTSFFASLPPEAHVYPLPYEWYRDWGIRRFGFHGISHAWCSSRVAELLPRGQAPSPLRLISCHLGNGCSLAAVKDGSAIATTMGFTPLDGIMMGTRPGSLDPGILTYVLQKKGVTPEGLNHILNHESGLLGVSGISSDFREIEAAAVRGEGRAKLAFDIYASRIKSAIGALTVTLGGLDVLVFTAGVGEHSSALRATVCSGLECLGVNISPEANASCQPDTDIATLASHVRVIVLRTQEELMIARETKRVLSS